MNQREFVKTLLAEKSLHASRKRAEAFAPSNIALVKYWGKRDTKFNLPITSSLSISLGNKGANTVVRYHNEAHDQICLNGNPLSLSATFSQRLIDFLDLFRPNKDTYFHIDTDCNIPISAGLASSACGFASLVRALNNFYEWDLTNEELSTLARLGSGSACRSLWSGFVEWQEGKNELDSHGEPINETWPELRLGLLILDAQPKSISSRQAMQRTVETSPLYQQWPNKVKTDLMTVKNAIKNKDFNLFGKTAENNALTMHATMMAAWPPIFYATPETINAMRKIWKLRKEGLEIYFTQDAGPNLKLLFLAKDSDAVATAFSEIDIINPFKS